VAIDPRHAELLFRRGQALFALGRFDEAEIALRQARDEDVCPLRALSPMRRVVTEVAREQGVPLVDFVGLLQQRMKKEKGHSIPGEEYFLDHVHPTIEGNEILAVALIQTMIDQGVVRPGADWSEQKIAGVASKIEGRVDRQTHGQALANLARVLMWTGKIEDAARLASQALDTAGDYQQVAADSASILATVFERQGHPERSVPLLYSAIKRAPGAVELHLKLGLALVNPPFNQPEKALGHLLLACQQMPFLDVTHEFFGRVMVKRGRLDIAYASLQEALRLNPNNSSNQKTLAWVRKALGGLTFNPELPQIMLEIYPSRAPRKLVQLRSDSNGRPVRDGIEVEFYENGRVKRFQDFQKGLADGLEISWDQEGRTVSQVIFDRGSPLENKRAQ